MFFVLSYKKCLLILPIFLVKVLFSHSDCFNLGVGTKVFVSMLLRFSKANVKKIAVVFVVVVVLRGIKQIRHSALTQNSTRKDKRISGGRKRFKENYLAFGADKREKKKHCVLKKHRV